MRVDDILLAGFAVTTDLRCGWFAALVVSLGFEEATGGGPPSEPDFVGVSGVLIPGHGPAGPVGDSVVVPAQQSEVFDVGRAVCVPVVGVVGVAPVSGSAAAGEEAAAVADRKGPALMAVGAAEGAAHSQRVAGTSHFKGSDEPGGDDEPEDHR